MCKHITLNCNDTSACSIAAQCRELPHRYVIDTIIKHGISAEGLLVVKAILGDKSNKEANNIAKDFIFWVDNLPKPK